MKKRLISMALALCMLIGILPMTSFAADTYQPWGKVGDIVIDKIRFYDIFGGAETRTDEMFEIYERALESSYLSGAPVYRHWDTIAQALTLSDTATRIKSEHIDDTSFADRYKAMFGDWIRVIHGPYEQINTNDNIYYRGKYSNDDGFDHENAIHRSGIVSASTRTDLAENLAAEIASVFETETGKNKNDFEYISGNGDKDKFIELLEKHNIPEIGPFFLSTNTVFGQFDGKGVGQDGNRQILTWGNIYYDFEIETIPTPVDSAVSKLTLEEEANGATGTKELYEYLKEKANESSTVPGITYNIETGDPKFSSGGVNESTEDVELTVTYGNTVSETATHTRSHTEEYTLSESLNLGASISQQGMFSKFASTTFEFSIDVGFEASQMWSDTWEDSTSYSNSSTSTTSSNVRLPAHTQILLSTGEGRTAFELDYDNPIAIRYKVLPFANWFNNPGDNIYAETFHFFTNFGDTELATGENAYAAGNLYNRYFGSSNYENLYGTGIDWDKINNNMFTQPRMVEQTPPPSLPIVLPLVDCDNGPHKAYIEDAVYALYTRQPYTATGGKLSANVKSTNTTIYGIEPLYPLTKIKTDKAFDYTMLVGDKLYLDNIELYALNDANVPYYGFDPNKGAWAVVDAAGNQISSDVVSITTDNLTGYTTLEATGAGQAYIQYFITENVYEAANSVGAATNETVERVAISVYVTNEQLDNGSITIEGELTGYVGDDPIIIQNVLSAKVRDAEGMEQNRQVTWQLQEANGASIDATGQSITFTQPGTYHVRAICDNVVSHASDPWYEITALPQRQLDKIVIGTTEIETSGSINLDDILSSTKAYDQYGEEWTDKSWQTGLDWILKANGSNITFADVTGGININGSGVFTLYARTEDGIDTNEITILYDLTSPSNISVSPANSTLPHTGGTLEFTITGENLINGMVVSAGGISGRTSGTSTQQIVRLQFPVNTEQTVKTYNVMVNGKIEATVTVSKAPNSDESQDVELTPHNIKLAGATLTLTDNIAINFKALVEAPEDEDYVVGALFWHEKPASYDILHSPDLRIEENGVNNEFYKEEGDYRVFSYSDIAAKEMNDLIYTVAYIKQDGRYIYSEPVEYSIVKYANTVLGSNSYSDKFKTLAVDMLNYGAAAQEYFGYRTDALANAGLTDAQKALGTQTDPTLSSNLAYFGEANALAKFAEASLSLESAVWLNFKAQVNARDGKTAKNVTLLYDTEFTDMAAWEAKRTAGELAASGMYYTGTLWSGTVMDIPAKELRNDVYAQVMVEYEDGNVEYSNVIRYSVESFAYTARNNNMKILIPLTTALMKYSDAAKVYLATLQ